MEGKVSRWMSLKICTTFASSCYNPYHYVRTLLWIKFNLLPKDTGHARFNSFLGQLSCAVEKEIPHKQMAEVNWFKCMSQHIADAFGSWQEDLWSVDPWTGPKSFNKLPFSFVAYKILLVKLFMCLQWAASPLHPSSFVLLVLCSCVFPPEEHSCCFRPGIAL